MLKIENTQGHSFYTNGQNITNILTSSMCRGVMRVTRANAAKLVGRHKNKKNIPSNFHFHFHSHFQFSRHVDYPARYHC